VALTILLATGWYVVAVTRGGEEFFDRQILQENLSRFVGGSGHSHPLYYYISYLFSQSLPWGLFLPFLLWDLFKARLRTGNGALFLKLWFVVMFAFFSISVGKRPVYLLPLYPSLALLLGAWFYSAPPAGESRIGMYRGIAAIAVLAFAVLLLVSLGQANWFFSFIEGLLKPHDRDNLMAVRDRLDGLGWTFTAISLSTALAWLSVSCSLWLGKIRLVAYQLVAVSVLHAVVGFGMVKPLVAANKSYRDFMSEVNRRVKPHDKLYLYGAFNSDAVVFYRGKVIETWDRPSAEISSRLDKGDGYLIMPEQSWKEMEKAAASGPPLLVSTGTGPQGDSRLVLLRADVP
jgi:hypothetical protein